MSSRPESAAAASRQTRSTTIRRETSHEYQGRPRIHPPQRAHQPAHGSRDGDDGRPGDRRGRDRGTGLPDESRRRAQRRRTDPGRDRPPTRGQAGRGLAHGKPGWTPRPGSTISPWSPAPATTWSSSNCSATTPPTHPCTRRYTSTSAPPRCRCWPSGARTTRSSGLTAPGPSRRTSPGPGSSCYRADTSSSSPTSTMSPRGSTTSSPRQPPLIPAPGAERRLHVSKSWGVRLVGSAHAIGP